MKSCHVAVYGATGHTGRFVAQELRRRGVSVRRISRQIPTEHASQEAGAGLSWESASCDDPDALDCAMQGAGAVINCAGPFQHTAPAVIEAALRVGAHYFDVSAEQRTVRQTLATYSTEAAEKGLVVLPAMAFYGGLADLMAAQLARELPAVEEILIGTALDYWHPTEGTRRTGESNTARRVIVSRGRLAPLPAPTGQARWRFPAPFGELAVVGTPLSEIITISRHIPARRIESFMNEAPLNDLSRADTPSPTPADASGQSAQRFVMDVTASGEGMSRRMAAFGRDIYAVSAPLVVEACMRVLSGKPDQGGCFAPAELFEPLDFLAALSGDIRVESLGEAAPLNVEA